MTRTMPPARNTVALLLLDSTAIIPALGLCSMYRDRLLISALSLLAFATAFHFACRALLGDPSPFKTSSLRVKLARVLLTPVVASLIGYLSCYFPGTPPDQGHVGSWISLGPLPTMLYLMYRAPLPTFSFLLLSSYQLVSALFALKAEQLRASAVVTALNVVLIVTTLTVFSQVSTARYDITMLNSR